MLRMKEALNITQFIYQQFKFIDIHNNGNE